MGDKDLVRNISKRVSRREPKKRILHEFRREGVLNRFSLEWNLRREKAEGVHKIRFSPDIH